MSNIVTDAKTLEEPKDPDTCNVFKFYELLAEESDVAQMRKNYLGGNYGYGHAKKELLELILERFKSEREAFNNYMDNVDEIEKALQIGAEKARVVARATLKRVREKLGYRV